MFYLKQNNKTITLTFTFWLTEYYIAEPHFGGILVGYFFCFQGFCYTLQCIWVVQQNNKFKSSACRKVVQATRIMFCKAEAAAVLCEDGYIVVHVQCVLFQHIHTLLLLFPYLNIVPTGFTLKGVQGDAFRYQADATAGRGRSCTSSHENIHG